MNLVSADLKLKRAQVHLDALNASILAWINTKPYTITTDTDLQRGEYLITTKIEDVPLDFGIIAGDFIHCLRGSLDHLAWMLAAIKIKHPARPAESVCFPIYSVYDNGTPGKIAKCTRDIDPAAVSIMESLQPYQYGSSYKITHLWRLNKLWNIDKHRHLTFHSAVLNANFPNIPQSAKSSIILDATDDGHIMRVPLAIIRKDVKFDPGTDIQVYFGDDEEGIAVTTEDFFNIYQFVKDSIFPRFQSFFT